MISICTDMTMVKDFMLLPEVYRYAAEHGVDKDSVSFNYGPKRIWLNYDDIGLIELHVETGAMCVFHPYILRKFKDQYDNMVREFFGWFIFNMPKQVVKLNATIPTVFKGALRAAERAKMKVEGLDTMSYRTSECVCDRVMMGITREEMKWAI